MFSNFRVIIRSAGEGVKRSYSSKAKRTALYPLHVESNGKMVEFGGYLLPVQYGTESISESHLNTRASAGLFDVSHMLQTHVYGKHREQFMESICTADVQGMQVNSSSLSLFTDKETGGILDDLIVTKCNNHLYIVSNASRREHDSNLMTQAQELFRQQGKEVILKFHSTEELSLLALQGPVASSILQKLVDMDLSQMNFMTSCTGKVGGVEARITRCGYTGEDGFEVSVASSKAIEVATTLLKTGEGKVRLAGLGARDTLRLEAGLCLYGNDIDKTTSPVSAGLMWTIGKARKVGGDYPGAIKIVEESKRGPEMKRIGLVADKKTPPARNGCVILQDGNKIGRVTSGCPSPTIGSNIAMGYVKKDLAVNGNKLQVQVRNTLVDMSVTKMPFVPPKYYILKK